MGGGGGGGVGEFIYTAGVCLPYSSGPILPGLGRNDPAVPGCPWINCQSYSECIPACALWGSGLLRILQTLRHL